MFEGIFSNPIFKYLILFNLRNYISNKIDIIEEIS